METYCKIILDLENDLSGIEEVSENLTDQMECAIGYCKIALDRLRKQVIENGFPDCQSEIRFFKHIKPAAYGRLLFYQSIFEMESHRPQTSKGGQKKYLSQKLKTLLEFMNRNHIRVQYYRCGFKHLDEQYFLRNNSEIPMELKDSHQLLDEEFFTWHDHTFSLIMANEMLSDYIRKEIERLNDSEECKNLKLRRKHSWSGKKIDYVEMVYALYYAKVVNNGSITIKELAEAFDQIFEMDIKKDIYRFYVEIQQRKNDSTRFLDYLRAIMQQRLDENNK